MATTTLTNIEVVYTEVTMPPEGTSAQPVVTYFYRGTAPDGSKKTWPVVTDASDMPTDATTWAAWWTAYPKAQAAALDYGIPNEPTFQPYSEE